MKLGLGFTLVELLVVVAISAVLFGGGLAAYRGIGDKQAVKQNGATFLSNLRSVQQKALASEKPTDCGTNPFKGYRVNTSHSSYYTVTAWCVGGVAKKIDLTDGVEFVDPFNIYFQVLKAEVLGAQTVTLSKGTTSYEVTIEQRGVISGELL
ncbi:MAG: type II secretion system protein [Candidatus Beckwithbacteria bacterium]|nr:type II secretion system protein [Candidatus Beckwithbacteria bacterium]